MEKRDFEGKLAFSLEITQNNKTGGSENPTKLSTTQSKRGWDSAPQKLLTKKQKEKRPGTRGICEQLAAF